MLLKKQVVILLYVPTIPLLENPPSFGRGGNWVDNVDTDRNSPNRCKHVRLLLSITYRFQKNRRGKKSHNTKNCRNSGEEPRSLTMYRQAEVRR